MSRGIKRFPTCQLLGSIQKSGTRKNNKLTQNTSPLVEFDVRFKMNSCSVVTEKLGVPSSVTFCVVTFYAKLTLLTS